MVAVKPESRYTHDSNRVLEAERREPDISHVRRTRTMKKKPIKLKQWVSGTLSATVLLSCMNTVVFAAEASPAAVQKPELMVTELVPDTENFTGTDGKASDAYEFIELYNPSETETRNLSEYNLVYYNGTKDYSWSLTGLTQENDITLTPGETLVIWVRNEDVAAVKTVEDFRSHYGLAENVKVAAITAGGMRNSATGTADGCGIRIQKDGAEIARAYYNENKSSQVQPDKAFTFGYGADGSAVLRMLSSAADPTPGTVDADSLLPPTTNPDPEPEPEPSPEPAALLITELLPNSSNMNKADAYEFVEVYNNSNKRINLKDYRLYYNNNLDASDNDVLWASFDKDLYLESGACMVFWIHNGSNDTLTVDDFNKKFGTNLVENQNIIILENGGMSNSAPRGLRITTNVHDEVNYVTYNVGENDANGNDHADKTITYRYDGTKSVKVSNVDTPTPGFIPTDLASVGATLQVPKAEPTVKDNTPETFDNDEGLTFSVTATSDGTTIKTVKLSYKDAKMQNYETYNLTRDGSGDDFKLTLTPADLTAKSSYTYYFTVSDGFKTVTTPVKTTSSTKVSEGDIHFNVTENEWISGTKRIITTGDTLQIGSNTMTAATPSIENKAKFIFEASQTDTFFKNAAAIGSDVLGIFNDGTYGEWKTYAYDVDPAYFTKGQTTTIDIHAGNKSNVLVHDAENNDDFVVRNIRLILPDGTTLRAESYVAELGKDVAEKNDKTYQKNYGVAENIKMGDSKNTVEILHVNFKPEDAAYNGIAYNLDTTKLPDGKVTISGSTGEQSQTVTVRVDNTAPAVQSNIENGQQYKGGNEIRVDVTDSGSGVASQTVKLDGKKITLPYAFASADMTPGSHTLTVTAEDTCGNKTNKNITFTTPEEDPMISQFSPADGLTQSTKPTFSAVATDPTGDSMTVSFKKGESYRLGDSNIQTSSGISNTSGSNTKDFDDGQSGNGFPFEQFDVTVGEQVSPSDDLNVQWTGKTNEAKTFLYAYNTVTGKWDRMDTTVTANEDGTVTLNGIIALTDHLDGRTVKVMVQSGEGYTPTQYAAGASAGTPTYSHITTSNEGDTPRDNYDFTFAVESDTQYYNEDRSNQGGRRSEPHRQVSISAGYP